MNELIFVVDESSDGGFTARALGVDIFIEAETRDEVSANVREAVDVYYADPVERPWMVRLDYVHDEVFAL